MMRAGPGITPNPANSYPNPVGFRENTRTLLGVLKAYDDAIPDKARVNGSLGCPPVSCRPARPTLWVMHEWPTAPCLGSLPRSDSPSLAVWASKSTSTAVMAVASVDSWSVCTIPPPPPLFFRALDMTCTLYQHIAHRYCAA
eukprot:scaffold7242_cov400-Prasinococcus_capsulatus_cf.AAC.26